MSSCSPDPAAKSSTKYPCSSVPSEDAIKMPFHLYNRLTSTSSFSTRTNLIWQWEHRNGIQSSWALPAICPICSTILHKPLNPIFLSFFQSYLKQGLIQSPERQMGSFQSTSMVPMGSQASVSIFRHLNIVAWASEITECPQLPLISEGKRGTNLWFKKFLSCRL